MHWEASNEAAHQIVMFCHAALGQSGAALEQFETCRRVLREELAVDPTPVPLTSFIGRERELKELERLVQTTRLLTLTGAGGCGKTRLASQLASRVREWFQEGIWWVELAGLREDMNGSTRSFTAHVFVTQDNVS